MSPYKNAWLSGEQIGEHRLIVQRAIGRVLHSVEEVHHKNGDKYDNRIENLEVLDAGDHVRLHSQKHPTTKTCAICGIVFTPNKTKRKRAQTCSLQCAHLLIGIRRRKVTPEKVKELLWMRNEGATLKEIGAALGISQTRVCQILHGQRIKTLK